MDRLPTQVDGPLTVIGDVHGQAAELAALIDRLRHRADFARRWVVFAGDFVDRGPDARGALDAVLALRAAHPRVTAVAGNHDFAAAAALGLVPTPAACNWPARWLGSYGADATFRSYGVPPGDLPALRRAMPEAHRQFLAGLPRRVEHPAYLVVHAGLLPGVPYRQQLAALRRPDLCANRPPWLCDAALAWSPVPGDCPVTVVSGHVRVPAVTFRDRRVLCDTTGGAGGELSAVLLPEGVVVTAAAGEALPDMSEDRCPST